MLKVNLLTVGKPRLPDSPRLWNGVLTILSVLLAIQLFAGFIGKKKYTLLESETEILNSVCKTMEAEKEDLIKRTSDKNLLAGAVIERNAWIGRKGKSPVIILSKFEKALPHSIEVVEFNADTNSGKIIVKASNVDIAARTFNDAMPGRTGRLSVESVNTSEKLITWSWTN